MVIESPAANSFTDFQHLRGSLRIGDAGKHAIGVGKMLRQHHRFLVSLGGEPNEVVSTFHHDRCLPVNRPMPDAFALHTRIKLKHRSGWWWRRVSEVDAVAVCITSEAQLETGRSPPDEPLDRVSPLPNASRDGLRTCPEGGRQTAFPSKRPDNGILSNIGQQTQRPIHTGFAASVRPSDYGELFYGQDQITKRPITLDSNSADHQCRIMY